MSAPRLSEVDNPDAGSGPGAAGTHVAADGSLTPARWHVAAEAPLALLYDGEHFGVMMVTPADLEDFALGFSLTEGIAGAPADVLEVRIARGGRGLLANVKLAKGLSEGARERRRSILAGSACGICGAQTVEAAVPRASRVEGAWPGMDAVRAALSHLPDVQPMNRLNRSIHAAGFARSDGGIVAAREDVGRHNALDKLAGALARSGDDSQAGFIVLSSRLSVEMVIKAARIGVPFIASMSAPTDLALEKAAEAGMGVAVADGDGLMVFGGEGR